MSLLWIRATTQGNEDLEGRIALIPLLRSKVFQDLPPKLSGCFSLSATEKTSLAPMFTMDGLDKREDNQFRVLVVASSNTVAQEVGPASSLYLAANHLRSMVHRLCRAVVEIKIFKARLLLFRY